MGRARRLSQPLSLPHDREPERPASDTPRIIKPGLAFVNCLGCGKPTASLTQNCESCSELVHDSDEENQTPPSRTSNFPKVW